jgi:hypothetical protein
MALKIIYIFKGGGGKTIKYWEDESEEMVPLKQKVKIKSN